ncbi:hypothetical protein JAAARDRAFT_446580 [Jaapia argillacea MUCL 33604]|uniref:Uncharacterized protein n=1 Tax=Jaapia argillacea MUCL 33604 TaxID=933084 RepID=A0A067PDG0_9AGAM|nr:hypothetical protein JAAARDRAFT_446580 [Jaapia argillacea MUCL 33604]
MAVQFGANPSDSLLKLEITTLSHQSLINLASAIMDSEIELASSTSIIELRGVDVYATKGGIFFNQYFESGFRLKGVIIVAGHQGKVDCSLSWTEGLKLKATMDGFDLGPLRVSGAKGSPNPILDVVISPTQQKFFLSGMIEIFSLKVEIFADFQWLPVFKFSFSFELAWSNLLLVKVEAHAIPTGASRAPKDHDFVFYALFEQHIIEEIARSVLEFLRRTHESIQKFLIEGQENVRKAKEAYERAIDEKTAELEQARERLQTYKDGLRQKLRELEEGHNAQKPAVEAGVSEAKVKGEKLRLEKRVKKDQQEHEHSLKVEKARSDVTTREEEGTQRQNEATRNLDNKKQEFASRFGNADNDLQRARDAVRHEQGLVNQLSGQIDWLENERRNAGLWRKIDITFEIGKLGIELGVKRAALLIAEKVLQTADAIFHSPIFTSFMELLENLGNTVTAVINGAKKLINDALDMLKLAKKAMEVAIAAAQNDLEKAERLAHELESEAKAAFDKFVKDFNHTVDEVKTNLELVGASAQQIVVDAAVLALELAKKNDWVWKAAEGALEALKKGEAAAYDVLSDAVKSVATLVDIQKVELVGVMRTKTGMEPFHLCVEGFIGGKRFKFHGDWSPGKTMEFLESVAKAALSLLTLGSSSTASPCTRCLELRSLTTQVIMPKKLIS